MSERTRTSLVVAILPATDDTSLDMQGEPFDLNGRMVGPITCLDFADHAARLQFTNASDALVWLDHCRTLVLDEMAKRDAAQTAATPECPEPDALTAADIDQLQNADVEAAR